jgi:hypothetical protein
MFRLVFSGLCCSLLALSQAPLSPYTLVTYGDSITFGDSQLPATYVQLIGQGRDVAISDQGVGGAALFDQIQRKVWGSNVTATTRSSMLIGVNDGGRIFNSPQVWTSALEAAYLWLLTPNKSLGNSLTTSPSGAWTPDPLYSSGILTTVNGASAPTEVWGTTVYVIARSLMANNPTFSVNVDGVAYGPFTPLVPWETNQHSTFAPYTVRISGLVEGHHSVVVTNKSAGELHIDFIAGNGTQAGPILFAASMYQTASLWEMYTQAINTAVYTVAAQLRSDGFNVIVADVASACANITEYDTWNHPVGSNCSLADGTHPNEQGEILIASAFLRVMPPGIFGTPSYSALQVGAAPGAPWIFSGAGPPPAGSCPAGSLFLRSDSPGGLYVCQANEWVMK